MEDRMKKKDKLSEKDLLAKNPEAAKVLARNRKKMKGRPKPRQREYGLGLPYARPALVHSTEDQNESKIYARRLA
jgi:hypothetical protein